MARGKNTVTKADDILYGNLGPRTGVDHILTAEEEKITRLQEGSAVIVSYGDGATEPGVIIQITHPEDLNEKTVYEVHTGRANVDEYTLDQLEISDDKFAPGMTVDTPEGRAVIQEKVAEDSFEVALSADLIETDLAPPYYFKSDQMSLS